MTSKRGSSRKTKGKSKSSDDDVSMWEMAAGREVDWQSGKNLSDSNLYMLVNQLNCDVTFRVGESGDIIPAHKYMLMSRSYVFQNMFSESEAVMEENDEVVVEDVDPQSFRSMLVYIYTDDVRLNPGNVTLILYAAKKYTIQTLRQRCLNYLEADLTADSACVIMEQAHVYEEEELRAKASAYIVKTADGTLRAQTVGELCHECLNMILDSDDLAAPEDVVFLAALFWSECELNRQGEDITPEGRREVLGDAIYKVRFPQIDKKFFVQNVSPFGVLNDVETNTVLQYYVMPSCGSEPFIAKPRKGTFFRPEMYEEPQMPKSLPVSGPLETPLTQMELPPLIIEPDRPKQSPETSDKKADKKADKKDKKNKKKDKKKVKYADTNLLRFSTRDELLSWGCDGQLDDAISFACDQDILLKGFLLFGPSQYTRGTYFVRAKIMDDKENILKGSQLTVEIDANPNDKFFQVPFLKELEIEKERMYTLVVNIKGTPSFQGSNGNHTVYLDDMTFKFVASKYSLNGTTVEGGQIPGLVINTG